MKLFRVLMCEKFNSVPRFTAEVHKLDKTNTIDEGSLRTGYYKILRCEREFSPEYRERAAQVLCDGDIAKFNQYLRREISLPELLRLTAPSKGGHNPDFRKLLKSLNFDEQFRRWIPTAEEYAKISRILASRYDVSNKTFAHGRFRLPIHTIWSTSKMTDPDSILGSVSTEIRRLNQEERLFLENEYGSERTEGLNYRMVRIEPTPGGIRIIGGVSGWYDHIISQMSLRWELAQAILSGKDISKRDVLPRRARFEEPDAKTSLRSSTQRAAAISTNTLIAIRTGSEVKGLLQRRSNTVAQFPGVYDVLPSAMFEAEGQRSISADWSIKRNVIREFLEEVLDDRNEIKPTRIYSELLSRKSSVEFLDQLISRRRAILSLTGVSVDLTTLVTEISTIFVIHEEDFKTLNPSFNWEYDSGDEPMLIPLNKETLDWFFDKHDLQIVPSGAATLKLGLDWLRGSEII